jgi:hypothetical protein
MANPRGQKRMLELARQERSVQKRERRIARQAAAADAEPVAPAADESRILQALAELHERYAAEQIPFAEFEATRDELMTHLRVG